MATGEHHINTYLTSAELDALIGSEALERGNYYYDTDKDWYLIAISPSKLIPVSGRLTITNGDTLPTGIEPDVLLVDTGVIDYDISESTGTPIAVTMSSYAEYNPFIKVFVKDITGGDAISGISMCNGFLSLNDMVSGEIYTGYPSFSTIGGGDFLNWTITGNMNGMSCRFVIEFHKSPFPV